MSDGSTQLRTGLQMFEGRMSFNSAFAPMAANAYFLETSEGAVLFDPSCGRRMRKRLEAFIGARLRSGPRWERAAIVAGHSHYDHAGNLGLSDALCAPDTRVLVHEKGFRDGVVALATPRLIVREMLDRGAELYNPFQAFYPPFSLLLAPFAALHTASGSWARRVFTPVGAAAIPAPTRGAVLPQPLAERALAPVEVDGITLSGWPLLDTLVFPTPGHSPCSVCLYWPEQRAVCVSDLDWIGNPVFLDGPPAQIIESLLTVRRLAEAANIELLLPGHGWPKVGLQSILQHLDFQVHRIRALKDEVLATQSRHREKDVAALTRILVRESPLFRLYSRGNYPAFIIFTTNMVAVCLKEEGLLR